MFVFIVGPALSRLSPAAAGEFMVKVVPRVVLFFQVAALLTVVFGLLLLYNLGGPGLLTWSTSYGMDLSLGVGFALLAFVESEAIAAPIQMRVVRLVRNMVAAGEHQPPPEFARAVRMAQLTGLLTAVLLVLASVFMVGAGFY